MGRLARAVGIAAIGVVLLLLVVRAARHERRQPVPAAPPGGRRPVTVVTDEAVTYVQAEPGEPAVADKETIMFKPSDQLIADTKTGSAPRASKPSTSKSILFEDEQNKGRDGA